MQLTTKMETTETSYFTLLTKEGYLGRWRRQDGGKDTPLPTDAVGTANHYPNQVQLPFSEHSCTRVGIDSEGKVVLFSDKKNKHGRRFLLVGEQHHLALGRVLLLQIIILVRLRENPNLVGRDN